MLYGNCISIKLEKNEVTEEGKLKQRNKKVSLMCTCKLD